MIFNEGEEHSTQMAFSRIEAILKSRRPECLTFNAKDDATEAYDHLRCHYFIPEAEELVRLLLKPDIKALLECHDTIANRQYEPSLPNVCESMNGMAPNLIQIVRLVKQNEPLGATIKADERTGAIIIARIMHGGAADRCGALSVGDEIVDINDIAVRGKDPVEVIQLLVSGNNGEVKLRTIPSITRTSQADQNAMHVRSLFSYDPRSDKLIPCREAGLSFHQGDILRLVNVEDPHWWQAVRIDPRSVTLPGRANSLSSSGGGGGLMTSSYNATTPQSLDRNSQHNSTSSLVGRTGLIPSRMLQQKKEQYRMTLVNQSPSKNKELMSPLTMKDPTNASAPNTEVLVYEEVELYLPDESRPRPILLVGPALVGKRELIRQLISTDPQHFREPIRITTKPASAGQIHGRDFYFVTKEEFETFQRADSLIDSYELDDAWYGLCIDSVIEIVQAKQVPVFSIKPQSLQPPNRLGLLKPYIVYVKPPTLDVLMETRNVVTASPSHETSMHYNKDGDVEFTESMLQQMIQSDQVMESHYGHRFDRVLVNDDLPFALEQLSELAYRLETEAFWIPKQWLTEDFSSSSISNASTA